MSIPYKNCINLSYFHEIYEYIYFFFVFFFFFFFHPGYVTGIQREKRSISYTASIQSKIRRRSGKFLRSFNY